MSTWNLLKESLRLSLDAVPEAIDIDKIERTITEVEEVSSIHHIHIWALETSKNTMTVHVAVENTDPSEQIKTNIRILSKKFGIVHATIETEPKGYVCHDNCCEK